MQEWLEELSKNRLAQNVAAALGGALIAALVAAISRKMGRLQYSVTHNIVGVSAQDKLFGNIELRWQGTQVANLSSSVLEVVNTSVEDFADLQIRIYTGDETFLLNEFTEVPNSPYTIRFTPEYQARIQVAAGQQASQVQLNEYHHNREYQVPVLNRGQRLIFRYLTTVPKGGKPAVWAATQHKGLTIRYVASPQMIMGVPVPLASLTAIVESLVVLVLVSLLLDSVWAAASITMLVALFGQPLGALTLKAFYALRRALYH